MRERKRERERIEKIEKKILEYNIVFGTTEDMPLLFFKWDLL